MTGWGQDGRSAATAGHDIAYIAVTGALARDRRAGRPPQVAAQPARRLRRRRLYLVVGVLAALHEARTGRGQVVDAAMVDGAAHLTRCPRAAGRRRLAGPARRNLLDGGAPFYGVYEPPTAGYVAVGALEPAFYAELLAPAGLDPARASTPTWPAGRRLRARLAERVRDRGPATSGRRSSPAPTPAWRRCCPRRGPAASALAARGTFVEHGGVVQPAPAPRFSRTPARARPAAADSGPAPARSLADWLG